MELILIFIFWIFVSYGVGLLGKDRNIGFTAVFIISLILTPIVGIIVALVSERISTNEPYISNSEFGATLKNTNIEKSDYELWKEKNPTANLNDYYRQLK